MRSSFAAVIISRAGGHSRLSLRICSLKKFVLLPQRPAPHFVVGLDQQRQPPMEGSFRIGPARLAMPPQKVKCLAEQPDALADQHLPATEKVESIGDVILAPFFKRLGADEAREQGQPVRLPAMGAILPPIG